MQKDIVFYNSDGTYFGTVDLDETKGEDMSKLGKVTFKSAVTANKGNKTITVTDGDWKFSNFVVEYFGSDGARRTGANNIEFADDTYTFTTNNNGAYHDLNKKKYYSLGILLKASSDIRYGLYASQSNAQLTQVGFTNWETDKNKWYVLNTTGGLVKGANASKKDADGNYWLIDANNDTLRGIYDTEVKFSSTKQGDIAASMPTNGTYYWKAETYTYQVTTDGKTDTKEVSNAWIPFDLKNVNGKTQKDHEVKPNNDYPLNFKFN